MKVLWLCNNNPFMNNKGGGGWFSSLANILMKREEGIELAFVFPGEEDCKLDYKYVAYSFKNGAFEKPYKYKINTEKYFTQILENEHPDIIHIWGTEYYFNLAMVNAAKKVRLVDRVIVHIQGLCCACKNHIESGLPFHVVYGKTIHDLVIGSVHDIKKSFEKRAINEIEILQNVKHVLGRTEWDQNLCYLINENLHYHFCREILRIPFYDGRWSYDSCIKHKVFISQASYSLKGLHYFLKAFSHVVKKYPDAVVSIGGKNITDVSSVKKRLYSSYYGEYIAALIKKYNLKNNVRFIGPMSAQEMKNEYLSSNIYVLSSSMENSSNSLGEALILGVPSIASFAGGTKSIIDDGVNGFLYQHDDILSLSSLIIKLFESKELCDSLSKNAVTFASDFYRIDYAVNDLKTIYETITTVNASEY